MSTSASALSRASIITSLRAAGCVFAEDEADLLIAAAGSPAELASMVGRRSAGLPLEQILGWAEFCGLRIVVEPGVFVPRQRTEFLVDVAIELAGAAADRSKRSAVAARASVVVDLCCGSAAIAAALGAALGDSICTHRISTGPRCAVPDGTWPRRVVRSSRETCSMHCRRRCGAGSRSWPPTCPTCPAERSR